MEPVALDLAIGALEALEMRSLTWGFVDQSLSEQEAYDTIAAALTRHSRSEHAADVLDKLCSLALVRMLTEAGSRRYRTRFAEMVRLLSRSRQWFSGQTWQAAPTLVSDFRVDTRARRYPRRNIAPASAQKQIEQHFTFSELQSRVWLALTGGDAKFALSQFQLDAAQRLLSASLPQELAAARRLHFTCLPSLAWHQRSDVVSLGQRLSASIHVRSY
jgi:hypothetical protein